MIIETALEQLKTGNVLVNAAPGSGKTYTITEVIKGVKDQRCLVAAFSTKLRDDVSTKLPRGVPCKTLHQLGLGILKKTHRAASVRQDKTPRLAARAWKEFHGRSNPKLEPEVKDLLERSLSLSWLTLESPQDVLRRLEGATVEENRDLLTWAIPRMQELGATEFWQHGHLSFSELLHYPATRNLELPNFDIVAIDECQDLSRAALEMVLKLSDRFLMVGDPNQAIFEFAGADNDSFDRVRERTAPTELQLPICRRSAKAIVANACQIYDVMKPMLNAPEGVVSYGNSSSDIQPGSLVLARNNHQLYSIAFSLVERGLNPKIQGMDLSLQLLTTFDHVATEGFDFDRPLEHFRTYYQRHQTQGIKDQLLILQTLLDHGANSREEVGAMMSGLQTGEGDVNLCTFHSSKGLEAEVVYLALEEEEKEGGQEKNVRFVGASRAKQELHYLAPIEKVRCWLAAA